MISSSDLILNRLILIDVVTYKRFDPFKEFIVNLTVERLFVLQEDIEVGEVRIKHKKTEDEKKEILDNIEDKK